MGLDATNNKVIYAGGNFEVVSPTSARSFLMDGSTTSWNPAPNADVTDIAVLGSKVYLIGTFSLLGATTRINFAAVDNNTGAVGGENLGLSGSDTIASITEFGGKIYMLGNFTSIAGTARRYGFSIDPTTGKISDWNLQMTGTAIRSLHIRDHFLYGGGQFTSILNNSRTNFFILNLNTLTLEGAAPTFNSNVETITTDENYIYIGGSFSNVAGTARTNIARLVLSNGALDNWNPIGDGNVASIHLLKEKVYVGGSFTNIGGSNTSYITAVSPTTGTNLLFPSATMFPNGYVSSVTNYQNQIFIGGNFTLIGGQAASMFSSFDNTSGAYTYQLLTSDNIVSTISIGENGKGVVGGYFTTIDGSQKQGFVYYDFLNKRILDSNIPSAGDVYRSISVNNTHYFGGKISQINYRPKGGFYFADINN